MHSAFSSVLKRCALTTKLCGLARPHLQKLSPSIARASCTMAPATNRTWYHDLEVVVPMWQGGTHSGVAKGAHTLDNLIKPTCTRIWATQQNEEQQGAFSLGSMFAGPSGHIVTACDVYTACELLALKQGLSWLHMSTLLCASFS